LATQAGRTRKTAAGTRLGARGLRGADRTSPPGGPARHPVRRKIHALPPVAAGHRAPTRV